MTYHCLDTCQPAQNYIVSALIFQLRKVESTIIWTEMLGHLLNVLPELGERVAAGFGHDDPIEPMPTTVQARTDLPGSPKLSILTQAAPTL